MARRKMPRGHWASGFVRVPANERVSGIDEKQLQRSIGVQEGEDDDGTRYLRVVFLAPEIPQRIQVLDCTSWLTRPELARALTRALFTWGRAKHPSTRRLTKCALDVFFGFLDDRNRLQPSPSVACVSELHVDVLNAYVAWLNDRRKRDGAPLGRASKNQLFLGLTRIVHTLRAMKEYAAQIDRELCLHRAPWANAGRYSRPQSSLDNDALARIESACIAEIDKTMALAEEAERLIKENAHRVPKDLKTPGAYRDLGVCLATITTEFAGLVPDLKDLYRRSRSLGFAIQRRHGGNAAVRERLFPSPRQMVPFVVLLAARTFFNPDTVLGLTWKQITPRNWFYGDERWDIDPVRPEERLKIRGSKGRSTLTQIRSFPARITDPGNPPVVLRKLQRLTARLRQCVAPIFVDRVFLFVSRGYAERRAPSYSSDDGVLSADLSWGPNLHRFIHDNDLPAFTLANLRATGSDLVHELTGGDILAQQTVLNHRRIQTTHDHYTSDAARQRNSEALARIQGEQVRWVETGGRRDVRGIGRRSTRRAVTPGFECVDPFDSPQPDQRQGRMCTAYPACPRCPLAVVNRRDPYALGYMVKLDEAFGAAQSTVAPQRWIEVLAPLQASIRHDWLPLFAAQTWREAQTLGSLPAILIE